MVVVAETVAAAVVTSAIADTGQLLSRAIVADIAVNVICRNWCYLCYPVVYLSLTLYPLWFRLLLQTAFIRLVYSYTCSALSLVAAL